MKTFSIDPDCEESGWAGSGGDRWLANASPLEAMVEPIGDALMDCADFRLNESVIDVGCGTGAMSFEIAERVGPRGLVTGLDISKPLVEEATQRAEASGRSGVQFILGDAAQAPLPSAYADCLVSRFGFMFFSNPRSAFAHFHGCLRQDGRAALACWASMEQNKWMFEVRCVLENHITVPPVIPRAPGPLAFDEPDHLRETLQLAEFRNIEINMWNGEVSIGGAGSNPQSAAEFLMRVLSVAQFGPETPESLKLLIKRQLAERLTPYMTEQGVRMPAAAWLTTAKV